LSLNNIVLKEQRKRFMYLHSSRH